MWLRHLWTVVMVAVAPGAGAAEIASHRAAYDLALTSDLDGVRGGTGRIVAELRQTSCGTFETDYRFVARFEREDASVVTDQRTRNVESIPDRTLDFRTEAFVDGQPESLIEGKATTGDTSTRVELQSPEPRSLEIALSVFPIAHLEDLIDKAVAGETMVETTFFDGDNEADKRLTTTAVIAPLSPAGFAGKKEEGTADERRPALDGLRAWRVHESYYNSDNEADGLPLYQATFDLYENGVSDNFVLDNGDYAFSGGLVSLDLLDGPPCD